MGHFETLSRHLDDSEKLYRQLVDNAPVGMHFYDLEDGDRLVLRAANSAAQRISGVENAKLIGRTLEQNFPVHADTEVPARCRLAARTGAAWETELAYRDGNVERVFAVSAFQTLPGSMAVLFSDITAQKRNEQKLRESEDRYRDLVEHSGDLICTHDLEGRLLSVNKVAAERLGYRSDEMVGRYLRDFCAPESLARLPAYLQQIRDHGWAEGTLAVQTAGGEIRYLRFRNTLRAEGLASAVIRGMAQDITERRTAERALARRDAVLSAVGRISHDLLLTPGIAPEALRGILGQIGSAAEVSRVYLFENLDAPAGRPACRQVEEWVAPGVQSFLSDPALQAFVWSEFGGQDIAATLAGGDGVFAHVQDLPGPFAQLLAQEDIKSIALVPVFVDRRWWGVVGLDACLEPRDWNAGEREALSIVAAILGAAMQKDRAKQRLMESEAKFRALVEQSLMGIFMLDGDRVVYSNPRAAEILRYQPGELNGVSMARLVAREDLPGALEQVRRLQSGEQAVCRLEYRALRKDGTQVMVGAQGTLVRVGQSPIVIGVMQDISEKVQAEQEVKHYVSQLEAALMRTVRVATTLSEMRDPYTAGHERRVGEIAAAIASEMGLDAHRQEGLRVAGYLHDIGKIIIPSDILAKPGKLSAAEYQLIKGHSEASYEVLKDVEFPWPVAKVALQHHERMDGSGYPRGLKGDDILLESRILGVADVVEAMSSHRPYRPGLGVQAALAEIERGRGTLYDGTVVDACLRLFGEKGYRIPA